MLQEKGQGEERQWWEVVRYFTATSQLTLLKRADFSMAHT